MGTQAVIVTSRAQAKLQEVLQAHGVPHALVGVDVVRGPHGCIHGWKLALKDTPGPEDTLIQTGIVGLLVKSDLVETLRGATIDYREDALGIGFTIEVPEVSPAPHGGHPGCQHTPG